MRRKAQSSHQQSNCPHSSYSQKIATKPAISKGSPPFQLSSPQTKSTTTTPALPYPSSFRCTNSTSCQESSANAAPTSPYHTLSETVKFASKADSTSLENPFTIPFARTQFAPSLETLRQTLDILSHQHSKKSQAPSHENTYFLGFDTRLYIPTTSAYNSNFNRKVQSGYVNLLRSASHIRKTSVSTDIVPHFRHLLPRLFSYEFDYFLDENFVLPPFSIEPSKPESSVNFHSRYSTRKTSPYVKTPFRTQCRTPKTLSLLPNPLYLTNPPPLKTNLWSHPAPLRMSPLPSNHTRISPTLGKNPRQ